MCEAAGLPTQNCARLDLAQFEESSSNIVLEIGPGTGVLTREILDRGAKVVAVEADERAIASLSETFPDEIANGTLTIFHHDARELDMEKFGLSDQQFKVVANIPYYISGLLFRQCLESDVQPTDLVFLVQKEVAERIARSAKESILSMSVKAFGDPSYICTIKRGHFTPPPAVDSAVIAIRNISRDNFINNDISIENYFEVLRLGFGQKRKQLAGNLRAGFEKEAILHAFKEIDLPDNIRAEDLKLSDFLKLTKLLFTK